MLGFIDREVQKQVDLEMQKKGILGGNKQKVLEQIGKKDKIIGKEISNICQLFYIWGDFNPILQIRNRKFQ